MSSDEYRSKAADMHARALREKVAQIKGEYENMALSYLRLAEQADRNAVTDIVYETPPEQPQVQEQEPQSEKKEK
jgi:hypothetical protein